MLLKLKCIMRELVPPPQRPTSTLPCPCSAMSLVDDPTPMKSSHSFHGAHAASGRGGSWVTRWTVLGALNVALILLVRRLLAVAGAKQADLFYLYYQPFAPFIAMLWLWGVNVRVFERAGIRYDVCFPPEEHRFLLPSAAILKIASVLSTGVLSSGCVFLFYCVQGQFEAAALQPPLVYSAALAVLLLINPKPQN